MGAIREIRVIGRKGAYELSVYVDEEDYQTLKLWDYGLSKIIGRNTTYIQTYKNGKRSSLHRLIMGLADAPRSVYVDHIDGNGLNNYRTNLRVTDNGGNQRNRRKHLSAKHTSSYKGVNLNPDNKTNPWQARIALSGKQRHLGYYRTQIEAACAYNEAAKQLFGPTAFLNELPDQ